MLGVRLRRQRNAQEESERAFESVAVPPPLIGGFFENFKFSMCQTLPNLRWQVGFGSWYGTFNRSVRELSLVFGPLVGRSSSTLR
jgi:hypothetical protein